MHATADTARTRALLEFVARRYRYVVLDVPRSDVSVLDALESVTSLVVVGSQEIGALKKCRADDADVRSSLRLVARARCGQPVRSQGGYRAGGNREGDRRCATQSLPSDYRTAVDALNAGRPVVLDKDKRLGRAFRRLRQNWRALPSRPRPTGGGMLSRLALRRA